MAAAGAAVTGLDPVINPHYTPQGLDVNDTHASASLLGQFRTSISSWLWLRTDLYLHNGVEMRPMTEDEKIRGMASEKAAPDHEKQLVNEDHVLTIIPSKNRDFRGIFGDIERATSAYRDMHNHVHNDPIAALPLFRLMTWIDPGFVPGWVEGAAIISRDHIPSASLKAIAYLKQGLEQNPNSVWILSELGELYITRMHNLPQAVAFLERARELGRHRENVVDDSEHDGLHQAFRWLALCYRNLGQYGLMRDVSREGLRTFKDDSILGHLMNPPPMILTPTYQQKWLKEHGLAQ